MLIFGLDFSGPLGKFYFVYKLVIKIVTAWLIRHCDKNKDRTVWDSNPSTSKRFVCAPFRLDGFHGPPSHIFIGWWGSFPGVKRPGREVDHSPPTSSKVKNDGS